MYRGKLMRMYQIEKKKTNRNSARKVKVLADMKQFRAEMKK
jgi:hypothetical protein